MPKRNPRRTDKEWLDLIQECRSSGLSDMLLISQFVTNQICSHIHTSNFYYQVRRLRQKACEIPEPVHSSFSGKQEVVPLSFEEPAVCPSSVQLKTDTIPDSGSHWGQTRAPSKGHFTEQVEILHEKRITTSFVSESCMALGNWNHEA